MTLHSKKTGYILPLSMVWLTQAENKDLSGHGSGGPVDSDFFQVMISWLDMALFKDLPSENQIETECYGCSRGISCQSPFEKVVINRLIIV
jgi:hypothetical protein